MLDDDFTNQNCIIEVGDGHALHAVDWGNKKAKTTFIYLHGGPGSKIKEKHKTNFDPKTQRVIFFDQRGCGESLPFGEIKNNDTEHLAKDITKIAEYFGIEKFYLFGYSWGSTLALYYAITRPEKVVGLVIGGVFSGNNDLSCMAELCKTFFPDRYEKFLMATPEKYRADPIAYHSKQVLEGSLAEQKHSIYWLDYIESTLASYNSDFRPDENYDEYMPEKMNIELQYIINDCFMEKDFLLKNAHKIHVPTFIVQGRCDMVCPPDFAYKIHKEIAGSKLYFANSNHHCEREIFSLFRAIFEFIS